MKHPLRPLLFLVTVLTAAAELAPAGDASLAKARAQYPVQVCVVSGEHLEAGQIVEYVYKEPASPTGWYGSAATNAWPGSRPTP